MTTTPTAPNIADAILTAAVRRLTAAGLTLGDIIGQDEAGQLVEGVRPMGMDELHDISEALGVHAYMLAREAELWIENNDATAHTPRAACNGWHVWQDGRCERCGIVQHG